jgi:hypothetical protein
MYIWVYGSSAGTIAIPSFGYSVELRLALAIQKFSQKVDSFDRGVEHDQRRCTFRIMVTEDQLSGLRSVLGRERSQPDDRFVLTLEQGSGFFPAGPDKGDSGDFAFSFIENIKFSAMKLNPYGLFDVEFRIMIHDAPTIAVSQAPKDLGGKFRFGDVVELRDPQIKPVQDFGSRRNETIGGKTSVTWTPTDEFRSDLTIRTSTGKMAELAQYLQTVRGDTFTVWSGRKYWMWGAQGEETAWEDGENVRLLDANFVMTHADRDLWSVPVQLWREVKL